MARMNTSAVVFVEMLQRVGTPITRAIAACDGGGVLLSTDRSNSFLDILFQCCAAGAADRVSILNTKLSEERPQLATTDGVQLYASRGTYAGFDRPAKKPVMSLDRLGLLMGQVVAVALDGEAIKSKVWRGANALIARDRPIFVAYAQDDEDVLAELKAWGYVFKPFIYWGYPRAATVFVMAVPQERAELLLDGDGPLIAPPSAIAPHKGGGAITKPFPQTRFQARDLELASGFYDLETTEYGSWVWSGPSKESRIVLPSTWVGSHMMTVSVINMAESGNRADLQFRINGRPVVSHITHRGMEFSTFIRPEEFSGAFTLSVIAKHVSQPNNMDPRRLGCCINQVEVSWS